MYSRLVIMAILKWQCRLCFAAEYVHNTCIFRSRTIILVTQVVSSKKLSLRHMETSFVCVQHIRENVITVFTAIYLRRLSLSNSVSLIWIQIHIIGMSYTLCLFYINFSFRFYFANCVALRNRNPFNYGKLAIPL